MKIRLITFHTPKNYGAVLQGFSLMSYLKKYSGDTAVIDFNTPHLRELYKLVSKPRGKKAWLTLPLTLLNLPRKKVKYRKFDVFVREFYTLTKRYESVEELQKDYPKADVYFTGSDQVFNPNRAEDERRAFYLDFLPDDACRVSYAASFGVKTIDENKKMTIRGYLNKFDKISVRENSGVKLVKEVSSKKAVRVADPVFLNDKEFWLSIAQPYKKKYSNYLFYYRLMGSRESDAVAYATAKEKGLRLVIMTDGIMRRLCRDVLRDVGPREFLKLMSDADFIVTDSFHGVAFSTIFQKQFIFSDMNEVTSERGYDLLRKCGIEKQAYAKNYIAENAIDYTKVNKQVGELIEFSKRYIDDCMQEVK